MNSGLEMGLPSGMAWDRPKRRGAAGSEGNREDWPAKISTSEKPTSDVVTEIAGRIMLVEDEPELVEILRDYLVHASFVVEVITDGRAVVTGIKENVPDLLLLDLSLPGKGGLEICREIRSFSDMPIIILTARVTEIDRLLGLEAGADDYICKPFSPREVIARVRTILRRAQRASASIASHGLIIDEARYRVEYRGVQLELTPVEFRLLRVLAATPGRVFSRQQLLDAIYADHRVVTDRTIDSHIRNLRRKLEEVDPQSQLLHSVYGVGYRVEF
jgi:two-component system, OmpR family, response regulator BaeR